MRLLSTPEDQDEGIARIVLEYIIVQTLYNTVRRILNLNSIIGFGFLGFLLVVFLLRNKDYLYRSIKSKIGVYTVIAFLFSNLYVITFLRDNLFFSTMIRYIAYLLLICLPFYVLGVSINDFKKVVDYWINNSFLLLLVASTIIFTRKDADYNMHFSYLILLPVLAYLYSFFRDKRIIHLVFSVYLILLIVFFGSRGPLLCVAVYVLLFFLCGKTKVAYKILALFAAILTYVNLNNIVSLITRLMGNYGINNRTLELLTTNLFYTSGRDRIQFLVIESIRKNWLIGTGPASDIKLIQDYPHNIVLELLMDYGVPIGIVILAVLLFLILRVLFSNNYKNEAIILIAWSIVPLFVSGTYLTSYSFAFTLGVLVYLAKYSNKKERVI